MPPVMKLSKRAALRESQILSCDLEEAMQRQVVFRVRKSRSPRTSFKCASNSANVRRLGRSKIEVRGVVRVLLSRSRLPRHPCQRKGPAYLRCHRYSEIGRKLVRSSQHAKSSLSTTTPSKSKISRPTLLSLSDFSLVANSVVLTGLPTDTVITMTLALCGMPRSISSAKPNSKQLILSQNRYGESSSLQPARMTWNLTLQSMHVADFRAFAIFLK